MTTESAIRAAAVRGELNAYEAAWLILELRRPGQVSSSRRYMLRSPAFFSSSFLHASPSSRCRHDAAWHDAPETGNAGYDSGSHCAATTLSPHPSPTATAGAAGEYDAALELKLGAILPPSNGAAFETGAGTAVTPVR